MTTPPKARKYRIRAPQNLGETKDQAAAAPKPPEAPQPQTSARANPVDAIKQIEAEGLSPKQLRQARRNAQRHGLEPSSDYDAVRMLRERDLDPFEPSRALKIVRDAQYEEGANLPAAKAPQNGPPGTGPKLLTSDAQAESIRAIQRDIVRRRRRNFALMVIRLCFFIFLPTALAGYYFFSVATPMYSTKSEVIIQTADSGGGGTGGGGGLFAGTGMATQQDSLAVQGYLQSREAMLRLDDEHGFISHYQQDHIDPIRRLPEGSSNEKAYKFYKRNIRISYDTTEGIIKLEIIAADPQTSMDFALALVSYAEEENDNLSIRKRETQMQASREYLADAERQMYEAQQDFLKLQKQKAIFDPTAETGRVMGQISSFETELTEKKLSLQQLLSNQNPSSARVNGLRSDINRLEGIIQELRASLTEEIDGAQSLASVSAELMIAEMNMETRQEMVTAALEEVEFTRVEAARQTRFLAMSVQPVMPDAPSYPRAFENTFLTLLVFSGVYLMISITAAVLREQLAG